MSSSTTEDPFGDYSEADWFGTNGVPDAKSDPIGQVLEILGKPSTMGNLEMLISESYKFIRMADDLNNISGYLNDMRICFIALTITGYIGVIIYCLLMCVRRSRRSTRRYPTHRDDHPERAETSWQPMMTGGQATIVTQSNDNTDLVSVRSEAPYRSFRSAAPSFMRHSTAATQQNRQTTKLMQDSDVLKSSAPHSIPHIVTQNADDPARVPQLAKDSLEPLV